MNKNFISFMAMLLSLILLMVSCTPAVQPPLEETTETSAESHPETEPDTQPPPPLRDTYVDNSANVPPVGGSDGSSATATAKGDRVAPDVILEFDGTSGLFSISSVRGSGCHDSATCENCGFLSNGEGYVMDGHDNGTVGFHISLASGIPVETILGIEATFRTTVEAPASALRVLLDKENNASAIKNECPPLDGAVDQDKTIDLQLNDPEELADGDGNLTAFQLLFRNKNQAVCTLKRLTIKINPEKLLFVDELEGNYFSRGDVTVAIAKAIATRFENADVGAEITVEVDKYRQNSSKMEGSILYIATAVLKDGSSIRYEGMITIPFVKGAWLDNTTSSFGSSHDSKGQWQDTFDPSGMVFLTDNILTCREGLKTMEYALIPVAQSHDDPTVPWYSPQVLDMSEGGFARLFVNGWLDHADILNEGESYRLLLRGVTVNNNYILHLDIPFVYSPLDPDLVSRMEASLTAIREASFLCPADTQNKPAFIEENLAALLGDDSLRVKVELIGEGVNSVTVRILLAIMNEVTVQRLPDYVTEGEVLRAVYAFDGKATTVENMTFAYDGFDGAIQLLTPFDGNANVVLASEHIYKLFHSTVKEIENKNYPFLRGENCLPIPVELKWSDQNAGNKTYTVTISKHRDLSDPTVLTTDECSVPIHHLEVGQNYYWQVTDGHETSQIFTFKTEDGYPRFLQVDGVSNIRDLGGYYTADGKRVKQNIVFRSAHIDSITEEGRLFLVDTLGIRTELDIRGMGVGYLGSSVRREVISMQWYSHIFTLENYEVVRKTIAAFAVEENYPMLFHCAVGRDRTGTTAFLILGLLGVDEETLYREYYASMFSQAGSCDDEERLLHVVNMAGLRKGLSNFGGKNATLQEQIRDYLLKVGVTEEEIASIRDILLEQ